MRAIFNKDFIFYSLAVLAVFAVLSFKVRDPQSEPANIISAVESGNPNPVPDDIQEVKPPQKVNLEGRLVSKMTYGRILLKNLTASASFSYFIAEPTDVDENNPDRESLVTKNITKGMIVDINGKLSAKCYWEDKKYDGCVPWVEIVTLATKSF